jgi:murein DD-endopeptidase MepM/ murein hydrolase activator NlpD
LSAPTGRNPRLLGVLLAVLLVVPLGASLAGGPATTRGDQLSDAYAKQRALQKQIAAQKDLLAALKASQARTAAALAATADQLDSVNADLAAVKAAVKEATEQLAEATDRYYDLVEQVRLLHTQLLWLEATRERKAAELEALQEALAQRLEAADEESQEPLLAQLLGTGSLNDVLVTVSYFLTMGEQDRVLAERVRADTEELATIQATVSEMNEQTTLLRDTAAEQRAELAAQRKELKAAQAQLKELQDETERLLAAQQKRYRQLAADTAEAQRILEEQKKAEAELQVLIDRLLRESRSRYNIPSQYNGTFIWPMRGTVTQEFGCTGFSWEPPLGSCAHFHRGIDIANSLGTPIRAAGDGVVIMAGKSPYDIWGAYMVVIAHSSRLTSWYAHVQTNIPVRVGQTVSQGQLIAYNGVTGLTTGPHLHWAVQLDGGWVNPRLFL